MVSYLKALLFIFRKKRFRLLAAGLIFTVDKEKYFVDGERLYGPVHHLSISVDSVRYADEKRKNIPMLPRKRSRLFKCSYMNWAGRVSDRKYATNN